MFPFPRAFLLAVSLVTLLATLTLRSFAADTPPSPPPAPPALSADVAASVTQLFAAWDKPDTPGAAVAVIHRGQVVYERGFGSANLEYAVPIRPETVFHVASVSKQFTAMAIVLLEQEGKLSIDDSVHQHLPELPDYGHRLTLRQLMNHTSGFRDQWNTLALAGWDLKDVISQEQILRLLFRQKELNFTPGERYLYSNGGFTLLAEVVRRVGGQPLPEFCRDRIFTPLGMRHTHFHLRLDQIVPQRAYSYLQNPTGFAYAPLNFANVGATSLFTTPGDLVRWLDNFRAPKVGTAREFARLTELGVLNSGSKTDYALGLGVGKYRGLRTVSHGGSDAGYRAHVLWFPDQEFGVAIASNHARFDPSGLAHSVADLLLAADFSEPKRPRSATPAPRTEIALDPAAFDKFTGTFAFDENPSFALTYTREGSRFYAQATNQNRFEIFPESPTRFFYKNVDAQVSFVADADGKVNRIIHHQNGRDQRGSRATQAPDDPAHLAAFAGHYWSEELEARYTFFVKDGKLLGRHLRHGEFPLTRIQGDRFGSTLWFMPQIEFLRDPSGAITAAKLGGGRVTGIHFTRQRPPVIPSTEQ